jgi:hypothetical protein
MSGLNSLMTGSKVATTTLPSWYESAQQNIADMAKTASQQAPTLEQTTAQGAINTLTGANNPFTQAQGTLAKIATGAASPWLASGAPDTSTALGGLFAAQKDYMNQMMPDIAARESAGAIGQGGFGSRMNLSGVTRVQNQALSDLFQKQMQAALQNQATGVSAATGLGGVGTQGIEAGLKVADVQQRYPYLNAVNYANIINAMRPGQTVTQQSVKSPLEQYNVLDKLFGGGLSSLIGDIFKGIKLPGTGATPIPGGSTGPGSIVTPGPGDTEPTDNPGGLDIIDDFGP